MLRALFIYLSKLRWMRSLILKLGFARKASRRFVAGETAPEAIEVVRRHHGRVPWKWYLSWPWSVWYKAWR